ncbi:MAG: diguanylate cyclase [Pseudomonadota bacterium]
MRKLRKKGWRLSIPVKVMLFAGLAYVITWAAGVYLQGGLNLDFSFLIFGIPFKYIYWAFQVVMIAIAASFASYYFLDRPLNRLMNVMGHAEEGDFLIRAPVLSKDEIGDLSRSFNHMLSRITDLAAHKIQTEHDLIVAQEELKYRKQIEEKSKIIARTNRTLEHLVKDLSLIYEIGQEVSSVVDLDKLYENITATLKKYLKISEFAILVYDDAKEVLHVRVANGFSDNEQILRMTRRKGEGISGMVAETGRRIYVKDTSKENRCIHYKGEHRLDGSSLLCAPLIYKGEILGVINFGRPGINSFSFSDIKMLSLVSGHVALAIANARLYTKTRELSVKDELTQVYNRRHFQQMLQMEWKRSVRFSRDISVVMIDVDHFKAYNDTYGHLQGDAVLKEIGKILRNNLREVDTVARFGGEEFILLLPDTDKHGAIAVAEKIRHLVEEHKFTNDDWKETKQMSISAGVASYPDDVQEMEEIIDHADIALYRAKEEGRNRVICYSPPVKTKTISKSKKPAAETADNRAPNSQEAADPLHPSVKTLQ